MVENLEVRRILKQLQEGEIIEVSGDCSDIDFNSPDTEMIESIKEGLLLSKIIYSVNLRKGIVAFQENCNPFPCYNVPCSHHVSVTMVLQDSEVVLNMCNRRQDCYDCLYQMTEEPPNSLDFLNDERGMPSHREALRRLEALGELKGPFWENKRETDYYRTLTTSRPIKRGEIVAKGITLNTLKGIVENELFEMFCNHKDAISGSDVEFPGYGKDFDFTQGEDRSIFARNIALAVEKAMGIYPVGD